MHSANVAYACFEMGLSKSRNGNLQPAKNLRVHILSSQRAVCIMQACPRPSVRPLPTCLRSCCCCTCSMEQVPNTHTVHYPRPAGGGTFSHKEGPPEMQETRDGRPMMMMSGRRRSKTLPAPTQSGGGGAKKEPKFNSCRSSSSKNTTANLDVNNIIRKSDRVPAASNTHGTVDGLKGASPVSVCLPPFHPLLQPHNKL